MSNKARRWWILSAMGTILGVILLDETVIGVALPTMQIDLDMSEVRSHWVVNIYMLVLAGLAAAAGKFGDIVGHKIVMNTGLIVFGLASLACGFAQTDLWLIAARGIQGAGAAIIFPSCLSMATIGFPPEQRGFALGIWGAIGTTFLAVGPLVGGFLTDFVTWRAIFWINPPICLAVAIIVFVSWADHPQTEKAKKVDKAGLFLMVGGLSMVVFAVMEGPDWGWTDPAIITLSAAGIVLLIFFVLVELRKRMPLIEVRLFTNPSFAASTLVIFSAQYSAMAMFVFGAMYFQDVLKWSPLIAGLALLPTVVPQIATAPLAGHVADRFGARWPSIFGVAAMATGLVIVSIAMTWESYAGMFPGLLLWGLSQSFVFVPPQRAVMNAVSPQKQGEAGGINMSAQLLGATIGMAICSTVFSMTGSIQAVYFSTWTVAIIVLVISWLAIEAPMRHDAFPRTSIEYDASKDSCRPSPETEL